MYRLVYVYDISISSPRGHLQVARWSIAFWKLQVWTLTEFDKLVWLDIGRGRATAAFRLNLDFQEI